MPSSRAGLAVHPEIDPVQHMVLCKVHKRCITIFKRIISKIIKFYTANLIALKGWEECIKMNNLNLFKKNSIINPVHSSIIKM